MVWSAQWWEGEEGEELPKVVGAKLGKALNANPRS